MVKTTTSEVALTSTVSQDRDLETSLSGSPNEKALTKGEAPQGLSQQLPDQASDATTRLDPITGRWTIFAPDRSERPDEFRPVSSSPTTPIDCPFCHGNESKTPAPVWIGHDLDLDRLGEDSDHYLVDSEKDDWSVRVVPNKYPAVAAPDGDAAMSRTLDQQLRESPASFHVVEKHVAEMLGTGSSSLGNASAVTDKGLFQSRPNRGGHEVIIESPKHFQSLNELDRSDACLVLVAYRDRIRYWRQQPGIEYISVFKNVGPRAGASLSHCHSQLIATSYLPSNVAANARRMSRHQAKTGCCLQCDLIRGEAKAKSRIVAKTDSLIAYCPFASRLPMLVRVTTLEHHDCFESLPLRVIEELAQLVSRITSWLQQCLPGVSYNYLLHTRPPGLESSADAQHWSFEIFPRLTQMAGFEWGSESMINPILPEVAAARYREKAAKEDPRQIL